MSEGAAMMTDIERIRDALQFVDHGDRETWLHTGMAIKSELGDAGFDLWEAWSQQAESFNSRDARDVWRSIRPDGGVRIGTLFYEAKSNGWRDDGAHQKPSPEELAERRRIAAERDAKEAAENAKRKSEARERACLLWAEAYPSPGHAYLTRKGIAAHGARNIATDKAKAVAPDLSAELTSDPPMGEHHSGGENPSEADTEVLSESDSVAHDYGGGRLEVSPRGVLFIGTDKDGNELSPRWICSPLPAPSLCGYAPNVRMLSAASANVIMRWLCVASRMIV
jgi:hypothetical protein